MKKQITGLIAKVNLKNYSNLLVLFCTMLIFDSCSEDCPDEVKTTKEIYLMGEIVKKTFPYNFKDTQIWINVNTNDTLHYILKDTVSTYDTTYSTPLEGCKQNNYVFRERFTFEFQCLEDSFLNYSHCYKSKYHELLIMNNIIYQEYGPKLNDIDNFGIIYKNVYISEYFAENELLGFLRITANKKKLYRIK